MSPKLKLPVPVMSTSDDPATARLKVDISQTGFFAGRQFRFEYEISTPIVFKFNAPINFILQSQELLSHDGTATLAVYLANQGVAAGTFDQVITPVNNNAMSDAPAYAPAISIASGGTFTPSDNNPNFAREYIKAVSATATAQRSTVGGNAVPERGLPAGEYYLVFTGEDASYRLLYEERP